MYVWSKQTQALAKSCTPTQHQTILLTSSWLCFLVHIMQPLMRFMRAPPIGSVKKLNFLCSSLYSIICWALDVTHFDKHFFFVMFIFERERETERERESANRGGAEREGDRGSEMGSPLTAKSLMWGSNSRTVRSWPESKSDTWCTEPPRLPNKHFHFFFFFLNFF